MNIVAMNTRNLLPFAANMQIDAIHDSGNLYGRKK